MKNKSEELKKLVIAEFGSPKTIESYTKAIEIGLWESERQLIEKYFDKQETILDVGCGTGRTTLALKASGYDVLGIDLVPAMIETAQKISEIRQVNILYEVGDATSLKFPNESFKNILFSFNGITQIPGGENRIKAIQEIYRVLKPGGHFIFTAHIRRYFGIHFFTWIKEFTKHYFIKYLGFDLGGMEFGDILFTRRSATQYAEKQFIHISSIKEVKEMIEEAGFQIVYSEYRNSISAEDAKMQSGNCRFFVCRK